MVSKVTLLITIKVRFFKGFLNTVVPAPGVIERVGRQGHAVVQVLLGLDVFERQALDVAVGVIIGENVDSLASHFLD